MQQLVSIIIPVYNVEAYLQDCLNSILTQSWQNIEVIAIDDGSTDTSLAILKRFAKQDARCHIFSQVNSGPSIARNLGLSKCHGDFITFLDSDDWVEKTYIEKLVRAMLHDQSDLAICGHWITYPHMRFKVCSSSYAILNQKQAIKYLLQDKIVKNYAWGKMFRRSLLPTLTFPAHQIYEDVRTIYQAFLKASRFSLVNEPLYHYRMRCGSITYSLPSNSASELKKAMKEQRSAIAIHYPQLISELDLTLLKANLLILYTTARDKLLFSKPV